MVNLQSLDPKLLVGKGNGISFGVSLVEVVVFNKVSILYVSYLAYGILFVNIYQVYSFL
jgi:hypothetical protein